MIYAGIGSRETPPDICQWMQDFAEAMARQKVLLRSGGADGADLAFEQGARRIIDAPMEIYLPWANFNDNPSRLYGVTPAALKLAQTVHTAWERLGSGAQKLHGRNTYQVLGKTLDKPVDFVICWTKDGCYNEKTRQRGTGGTATAIVLADRWQRPVFNLKNEDSFEALSQFLAERGFSMPEPPTSRQPQQFTLL